MATSRTWTRLLLLPTANRYVSRWDPHVMLVMTRSRSIDHCSGHKTTGSRIPVLATSHRSCTQPRKGRRRRGGENSIYSDELNSPWQRQPNARVL